MKRKELFVTIAATALVACAGTAMGQGMAIPAGSAPAQPAPVRLSEDQVKTLLAQDMTPQQREEVRKWNKRRVEAEKQMKTIRFKSFGGKTVPETRQAGIAELRKITDSAAFPSMLDIYRDEQADVQKAIVDHLSDLGTDHSLTTLAYIAVNEKKPEWKRQALESLTGRVQTAEKVPSGVKSIIADGLQSNDFFARGDAARLAVGLKLTEAIPAMIAAQISPSGGGSAGGYIAYIAIGQQRAYVADLEPVVGDGSVAFDPVPGVLTEGVVIAINDAVVVQYSTGVHEALVGFTSRLSGEDTSKLGWSPRKWQDWYAQTLLPKLQQQPKAETSPAPKPTTMAPQRRKQQIAV